MLNRRSLLGSILGFVGVGGVAVADPVSRLVNQPETYQLAPGEPIDNGDRFISGWLQDNPSIKDLARGIDYGKGVFDSNFPGKFSIPLVENLIHTFKRNFPDRIDYILIEKQVVSGNKYKYFCDYDLPKDEFSFCGIPIKQTTLELSAIARSMGLEYPFHFAKGVQWNPNRDSVSPKVEMFKIYNKNVVLAVGKGGNVLLGSF